MTTLLLFILGTSFVNIVGFTWAGLACVLEDKRNGERYGRTLTVAILTTAPLLALWGYALARFLRGLS